MVIKTDSEGKKAIMELCDVALKSIGISGMNGIANVINSIEIIEEKKEVKK